LIKCKILLHPKAFPAFGKTGLISMRAARSSINGSNYFWPTNQQMEKLAAKTINIAHLKSKSPRAIIRFRGF